MRTQETLNRYCHLLLSYAAPGRTPYSENVVHFLMCFTCPVDSSKVLQPYTAAFGGVYTSYCQTRHQHRSLGQLTVQRDGVALRIGI